MEGHSESDLEYVLEAFKVRTKVLGKLTSVPYIADVAQFSVCNMGARCICIYRGFGAPKFLRIGRDKAREYLCKCGVCCFFVSL